MRDIITIQAAKPEIRFFWKDSRFVKDYARILSRIESNGANAIADAHLAGGAEKINVGSNYRLIAYDDQERPMTYIIYVYAKNDEIRKVGLDSDWKSRLTDLKSKLQAKVRPENLVRTILVRNDSFNHLMVRLKSVLIQLQKCVAALLKEEEEEKEEQNRRRNHYK